MARNFSPVIEHPVQYAAARKAYILANANKTFFATFADAREVCDFIGAGRIYNDYGDCQGYKEGFVGSLAQAFDKYGKLTLGQVEAVRKCIARREERKAEWADQQAALNAVRQHLGTVGEKITLTLTIKRIVYIDGFRGNSSYIYICEDAARNVVIYKGNAECFTYGADGNFSKQDDVLTVTATVKEHGVREGVKQTIIQRPKAA